MYKGAYEDMEPVYNAMAEWMKEKSLEPTGVSYEYYYNSPAEVPLNELLTKIVFPLK
jgi:effector-binding domain-containing protein